MLEASLLSHEHFYIKSYTFYENEFEINLQFDMHFNEEKVEQIGKYNYTHKSFKVYARLFSCILTFLLTTDFQMH